MASFLSSKNPHMSFYPVDNCLFRMRKKREDIFVHLFYNKIIQNQGGTKMKKKPGVMIYFSIRQVLKRLTNEDKGVLFDAILEYAETGKVGVLPDTLYVVWPLIQMSLLSDDLRYRRTVVKRRYAAYVRWARDHGAQVQEFPAWAAEKGYDTYELDVFDLDT